MPPHRGLPLSMTFDLARLGWESWVVMALRAAKLAAGGTGCDSGSAAHDRRKDCSDARGSGCCGDGFGHGEQSARGHAQSSRAVPSSRESQSPEARL
jgi:hypothetical protein